MPEGYELPRNPLSRDEIYLDILCGSNRPLPPLPVLSRTEAYLRYLCENGGQGSGSGVAKGYYYEGNFYEDAEHTKLITPEEGNLYYDRTHKILYIYKNGAYAEMGDADVPVKDVQVDGESVVDENGIARITMPEIPTVPVQDVKVNGESVVDEDGNANVVIPAPPFPYEYLRPVGDIDETYLAYASYVNLDYTFAKKYLDENAPAVGGCSAFAVNGYFGRTYDWLYSNSCEFVVSTPAINGRHGVLGVVGNVPSLTKDFVKSGEYSDMYKVLPFMLTDGKNDAGLRMSINVVPNDNGDTTGTHEDYENTINALMLVRWALDNCATVQDVINAVENSNIYVPQKLRDMGYEVHFLVSDDVETQVLEFINNETSWSGVDQITNFFVSGVNPKEDGTVPVIGDSDIGDYGLTDHAMGLERYNIIVNAIADETDPESIVESLAYTNLYTLESDKWYSELCAGDLTIESPVSDFEAALEIEVAKYQSRTREAADTWQSVHSVVYDDDNGMVIWTQENIETAHIFDVPKKDKIIKDIIVNGEGVVDDDGYAIFNVPVQGVKVNGVSVVDEDGNANIEIPEPTAYIEFGESGQTTPSANLMYGGLFIKEVED